MTVKKAPIIFPHVQKFGRRRWFFGPYQNLLYQQVMIYGFLVFKYLDKAADSRLFYKHKIIERK
jgi:hypothetical protein